MLYDAQKANQYANLMLQKGVYVIPFSFPVVPKGKARIRTQISAAHTTQELQKALDAFADVKRELGD
jgi:glycine C-acetyltransferase